MKVKKNHTPREACRRGPSSGSSVFPNAWVLVATLHVASPFILCLWATFRGSASHLTPPVRDGVGRPFRLHSLSQTVDHGVVHPSYLEQLSLDTKEPEEGIAMLLSLQHMLQKILFTSYYTEHGRTSPVSSFVNERRSDVFVYPEKNTWGNFFFHELSKV